MFLKIPILMPECAVACQVRGFSMPIGTQINVGDVLAELRYEVISDEYIDCPLIYYGDLVAADKAILTKIDIIEDMQQGDIIALLAGNDIEFNVNFITL